MAEMTAGRSRALLEATCASEVPRNIGRQSSEESSQFHEELANLSSAMTEVQEIFTQLLENFDSCTPHSRQHARAMNELWSFYESHSDELEAGAAELEAVLCTRHSTALGQPMYRMSTLPSDMTVPQHMDISENPNRQYQFSGKQQTQHCRSRSWT